MHRQRESTNNRISQTSKNLRLGTNTTHKHIVQLFINSLFPLYHVSQFHFSGVRDSVCLIFGISLYGGSVAFIPASHVMVDSWLSFRHPTVWWIRGFLITIQSFSTIWHVCLNNHYVPKNTSFIRSLLYRRKIKWAEGEMCGVLYNRSLIYIKERCLWWSIIMMVAAKGRATKTLKM